MSKSDLTHQALTEASRRILAAMVADAIIEQRIDMASATQFLLMHENAWAWKQILPHNELDE